MNDTFDLHVITSESTATSPAPTDDQFEGHALRLPPMFLRDQSFPSEKLVESWRNTNRVIAMMVEDAKAKEGTTGIKLNEIEVTLAVSAEGNIGFVSGKADAGIVLKFTRG